MSSGVQTRVLALVAIAAVLLVALSVPASAAGKTLHITKSESDGDAVQGATFTLYRDDPPKGGGPPKGKEDTVEIGKCTTGANGQCDITDVPPGDYWLSETGPPTGYTPAPDSQVKMKRKNKEVVVVDDKTPTNTSVNDPTGDASVQDGTHVVQFGASTAVDATGMNVVVLFNDTTGLFDPGDDSATGFAYSSNGGESFVDGGKLPPGTGNAFFGEPFVAYNPAADTFLAANVFCNLETARCPVAVSRSTDAGRTWGSPVLLHPTIAPSPAFGHGARIEVDPQSGAVHVVWTLSSADETSQIMYSRSTDGGLSFEPAVALTDAGHYDFPSIDQNPINADLFVSWGDYGGASEGEFQVFVQRSRNDGDAFGAPRPVAGARTLPGHEGTCGGEPRRVLPGRLFALDAPSITVDPRSGALYMAWTDRRGADQANITFSRSEDNGRTWSTPEPITPLGGPQGGLQFRPFVDVTPNGRVGVGYYDSRIASPELDYMMSFFRGSNGVHIADVRVTEQSFPVWQVDPSYDSALNPCAGIVTNTFAAPGSGFLVAFGDGSDPGPAGNRGVDPNISFAQVEP